MKKIGEKVLYEGKWFRFKETICINNNGNKSVWEHFQRTGPLRKAVIIVGKLVQSNRYILIKQYRPAIDDYVIAFPAGMCDNENTKENVLRELKEETGYVGKVKRCSPSLVAFPAVIDSTVRICEVEIDEDLKENKNPIQDLEPEEDIEVMLKTKEEIIDMFNNCKYKISTALWYVFGIN